MRLKVIKSQQSSVERSHVVLKLILNSDQGPALFRQKQILTTGLLVTKNLQKSEDFFIKLLYAWLHLTNKNFPAFISIEEILDQSIFLNPHTRMDIKHPTQEYFKFTIYQVFCYNNKVAWKVKDFQKLSKRNFLHPSIKIVLIVLNLNSTKYNKPFKFSSWPNFLEELHILSPHIWGKTFIDWFKKCSDGQLYIFYLV